ncbi:hypothetical protein DWX59_05650 [Enterocloster aldenensis]|nr:hypothetical protein [Clostridiales bacterium AHG0011]RGC30929.1 hypothetical protein DWX59_05650 [Enterocloster aldenensis]RGC62146.1 hypothetical protein DW690_10425 [Dorea longicatena]
MIDKPIWKRGPAGRVEAPFPSPVPWSLNPACIFRGMCYNVHIFLLNEYFEHKWDGSEDLY